MHLGKKLFLLKEAFILIIQSYTSLLPPQSAKDVFVFVFFGGGGAEGLIYIFNFHIGHKKQRRPYDIHLNWRITFPSHVSR